MWIICASIAVLLIVIGVNMYLNKKNSNTRGVIALGCIFGATLAAYMPAYISEYGAVAGFVGNLIHTLRVVTVDADVTEFYEVISTAIDNVVLAKAYIVMIGALHLALPTLSAVTAVTVLLRYFSTMQMHRASKRKCPMFIFSEVNERSLHLAKSLEKIKCDIVFAGSTADSYNGKIESKHSVILKDEEISELAIKNRKGKEIYFFCISEDEDVSLGHTLDLIERFSSVSEAEQEHIHIYQFSKHQDFAVFIDSSNKGMIDVQCINEYEMLVYNLLDRYPLMKYSRTGAHVLIHGLSDMNIVALKAIIWCGQMSGFSLRASVVGVDIGDRINELRMSAPGLFTDRYDIRFFDCKTEKEVIDTIRKECSDANYIIVGEHSDNDTMNLGISLRRLFYIMDPEFSACPPIFCYIKEPSKFSLIKDLATAESNPKRKVNYDLTPFGSLEEVYTYETLVNSRLENIAKNVHLAYEEIFSDGEIDVKEALKRYNIFEVNKRSNRGAALHIRYKLNMLGLDYKEVIEPEDEELVLKDAYTDEALESMSVAEHDRWMAFLETEGWIPSEKEEVDSYRNSGISRGRHNCPILKMHPYICEYEKLRDLSIELEGKDTTVYDKELIVRIPDILGDKWNVSGKKYKIVRLR